MIRRTEHWDRNAETSVRPRQTTRGRYSSHNWAQLSTIRRRTTSTTMSTAMITSWPLRPARSSTCWTFRCAAASLSEVRKEEGMNDVSERVNG